MRGQVLGGRYHLYDVLGSGGMSVVWRARDEVLDRDVAVKLLSGPHAVDRAARHRIRVEARSAAALAHPNVAQVHDFGETVEGGQRTPYVVMELVPGPTLEEHAAAGPLPPTAVVRVCAEVAAALAAAHTDGLVHRDVKPANVILAPTGAKVVDFGIAASAGREGTDANGGLLGTADYIAPERLVDDTVTPASDVYSLGVLLYKLLTGRQPWRASGAAEILHAHLHATPEPIPDLPGVPPGVVELCLRCLDKDPARRPTAAEVAATLTAAATSAAAISAAASAAATAAADRAGRSQREGAGGRRRSGLALAAAGAVTAASVTWLLVPAPEHSQPADARPATVPADASGRPGARPSAPASAPATGGTPAAQPPGTAPATGVGAGTPAASAPATPEAVATPAGSDAPTDQPGTAPAGPRSFTSDGGTVRAQCTGAALAELLSWTPVTPYRTDWVNPGPATAAVAAFTRGNLTVDMTVTCDGTVPTASVSTHGG
ncbi:protein kinase [Dactylosporangium aurantiacum]|uniref:non-specific serine/threonine protein kinase n=1 Tax=Dactylosporangium aurantiacum TaxID=35754 RepID=A0A9Q9IP35_9ACTN|nr:serine/threonine-protein kinase [Dactylosporangium aurantiacum]MDG6103726.1 protein kinase [Dactylosporangium aurantiacum]UWZ59056.1 protein kinase [Dactylosporangium aurantiacum]